MYNYPIAQELIDNWIAIIKSPDYNNDEKLYTLFELLHCGAISLNKCLEYVEEIGLFSESKMIIDWNKSLKSFEKNE